MAAMPWRMLISFLFMLMHKATPEALCTSRESITVLEGEHFYLKCCQESSSPSPQIRRKLVKWYKGPVNDSVELNSRSMKRLAFKEDILEFWPVEMSDRGTYYCTIQNGDHISKLAPWDLKVIRRDKDRCFNSTHITSKPVEVGKALNIDCTNDYYQETAFNKSLITNCSSFTETNTANVNAVLGKNGVVEDAGYYTCFFFFYHEGKIYNATKTFEVTINQANQLVNPTILGPQIVEVEVELGKEEVLNCTVSGGDLSDCFIYWIPFPNNTRLEEINLNNTYMNDKIYASSILRIKHVEEKDFNTDFNCTLLSASTTQVRIFRLIKKVPADIPKFVFTAGMIAAVSSSAVLVFIVVLCVICRVDLVLLYRDLAGKDETLADGKTYDAFVSYQSDNQEENIFVLEILARILEDHFRYKLCLVDRDVAPGGAVVDGVQSLIEKSRRLIIVLSQKYMRGPKYELSSGLHNALVEKKIQIILIEFLPLNESDYLPQSLELLKPHSILKWKGEKSLPHNSRFWKNLRYLMPVKGSKSSFCNLSSFASDSGSESLPVLPKSSFST
ncbi:interleukin-18 receptor 1 [Tachyglossus aculeatus]|uniref:interleukin-18 receptor 1 n=1 Tax=Tachyglossus aculeatus TaxID=9261 RepID=UPI0018F34CEC|nr:interleukin-18 receptor 1 [Tachyglossus aculeatus]